MSLTADQHRRMGEILGYPSCCVEAFVEGTMAGVPQGRARGVIYRPDRTDDEKLRLDAEVTEMLGRRWVSTGKFHYVPCETCVGSPGYKSYDEHHWLVTGTA